MDPFSAARERSDQIRAEAKAFAAKRRHEDMASDFVIESIVPASYYDQSNAALPVDYGSDLSHFHDVLKTGILPDELVPEDAFTDALTLKSKDQEFQDKIGPNRYFALVMRDKKDVSEDPKGKIVGAMGFQVFCHKDGVPTIHSSYYGLLPKYRGMGLSDTMMKAVSETSADYVSKARPEALSSGTMVQIIETNDISKMSLQARLDDEAMALHPLERTRMWQNKGFREIDGIQYKQREEPPIPLALMAQVAHVSKGPNGYKSDGFSAPDKVSTRMVYNHVNAFDNLLMNYEDVKADGILRDPQAEGLVKLPSDKKQLATVYKDNLSEKRAHWDNVESKTLKQYGESLPLESTMAELSAKFAESKIALSQQLKQ